ncbi:hypothetical protein UFOVP155_67 [uncultured Caudovirales phage]|uniref:Uncharacterized protein n=1 Tax=uncultured Caudovirales phage TaxID=2100421 RepID=A0A6J7WA54_9CAUD|nr:hypothetical protein UFOVP155_67 [uncultured Caudovirales phage]
MSFKYNGLIKSLEICSRNEWGDTSTSRSIMRSLIWEATQALIDCKGEIEDAKHRQMPSTGKAAFSEHGLAGCIGLKNGQDRGAGSLYAAGLEDENHAKDHRLGSLLKRTGI